MAHYANVLLSKLPSRFEQKNWYYDDAAAVPNNDRVTKAATTELKKLRLKDEPLALSFFPERLTNVLKKVHAKVGSFVDSMRATRKVQCAPNQLELGDSKMMKNLNDLKLYKHPGKDASMVESVRRLRTPVFNAWKSLTVFQTGIEQIQATRQQTIS